MDMENDIREHWYDIVNAVFHAEHDVITDDDRTALKEGRLQPCDYIYKVVDEILSKSKNLNEIYNDNGQ